MGTAIIVLIVAAVLFVIAGICFADGSVGSGVLVLLLGVLASVIGTISLYTSGVGRICRPYDMPNQIYSVVGQVETPNEVVAIIGNSDGELFAVWAKQKNDDSSILAKTARFAKRIKVSNQTRFVEVPVELNTTDSAK